MCCASRAAARSSGLAWSGSCGVHDLTNDTVAAVLGPFISYLAIPDLTVYLHTSPHELARRMRAKHDQTRSDHDLLTDPELLQRLQDRYDQIAATDPAARHLQTGGHEPAELADRIAAIIPAVSIPG